MMAMLEITNRCNMSCPLCFTDARHHGPDVGLDEIQKRLDDLLEVAGPIPLQISGGEPTLHPHLAEIVAQARRRGFGNIELVTNGVVISANPDYLGTLVDHGLTAVYLQFDGVRKETYEAIRGRDMGEIRIASIEAIRAAKICCTLAVAVTPGVNDQELGEIVEYAVGQIDTVRAVNFQSATRFAGRYPVQSSERGYNLEELVKLIEMQCGLVTGGFVSDLFGHPKCNAMSLVYVVDGFLKPHGPHKVTVGGDSRPANDPLLIAHDDAEAEVLQQFVLGFFHVAEVIRKMQHAGQIGVGEIHSACNSLPF